MTRVRWERDSLGFLLDLDAGAQGRIVSQAAKLRRFPELGVRAIGRYEGKRRLVIGPYSLVYEYDSQADTVSIVALARGGPLFR